MRFRELVVGSILMAGAIGCTSKPQPSLASGALNAGVNEAAYPTTIGPQTATRGPHPVPEPTPEEHIASVERSRMPPKIKRRIIEEIRREHGLPAPPPEQGLGVGPVR